LDSWLSDLLQSELKMKLSEVEGARAPVPHSWRRSWRRHWRRVNVTLGELMQNASGRVGDAE